ncbi:hypothetical protein SEPL_269 [Salmonella phage SE_PL]|uniref:hypothetical protein n=1 Tax=Salmonella enterica TaxID=28901 RepID=UPI000FDFA966|nr:hypothetical protein CPT_Munch_156 [Salmonella phage Munch]EAZ2022947.1 hypothetical protein [Salmonella enterica]ECV9084081.1 hypothetical protein [Salmonella enterica subsp. enterica serovar Infantis]MCP0435819.1 hypothetical protein [Salmonella enterica subsp. enterica serovar Mbandaka]QCW18837.1 hypothetical protein 7t3_0316 [Salmonella phage 7t3]QIG62882.1 hypothetical protein SEPL_269 [Salmonella phage SE_PL]
MTEKDFLIEYMKGVGESEMRYLFEEDRIIESDFANVTEEYVWVEIDTDSRSDADVPDFGFDLDGECYDVQMKDIRSITEYYFEDDTDFDGEVEIQVLRMKDGTFLIGDFGRR